MGSNCFCKQISCWWEGCFPIKMESQDFCFFCRENIVLESIEWSLYLNNVLFVVCWGSNLFCKWVCHQWEGHFQSSIQSGIPKPYFPMGKTQFGNHEMVLWGLNIVLILLFRDPIFLCKRVSCQWESHFQYKVESAAYFSNAKNPIWKAQTSSFGP